MSKRKRDVRSLKIQCLDAVIDTLDEDDLNHVVHKCNDELARVEYNWRCSVEPMYRKELAKFFTKHGYEEFANEIVMIESMYIRSDPGRTHSMRLWMKHRKRFNLRYTASIGGSWTGTYWSLANAMPDDGAWNQLFIKCACFLRGFGFSTKKPPGLK